MYTFRKQSSRSKAQVAHSTKSESSYSGRHTIVHTSLASLPVYQDTKQEIQIQSL